MLEKMNFNIIELEENYEKTRFDGIWIYSKPMFICMDLAPTAMNKNIKNYYEDVDEKEQLQRIKE